MEDFNLSPGNPVISNDIDYIKQQINILFDSREGDLHGDMSFGTDYEKLLYELRYREGQLEDAMRQDLYKLQLMGFEPQIEAYYLPGTEREIAVIDVHFYRNSEVIHKTYKIE